MPGGALAGKPVAAAAMQGEVGPGTRDVRQRLTWGIVPCGRTARCQGQKQPSQNDQPHALPITTWLEQW